LGVEFLPVSLYFCSVLEGVLLLGVLLGLEDLITATFFSGDFFDPLAEFWELVQSSVLFLAAAGVSSSSSFLLRRLDWFALASGTFKKLDFFMGLF
jgi:hypothetical protein